MSGNGLAPSEPRTVVGDADGIDKDSAETVRINPLKLEGETVADDADANFPLRFELETEGAGGWKARI